MGGTVNMAIMTEEQFRAGVKKLLQDYDSKLVREEKRLEELHRKILEAQSILGDISNEVYVKAADLTPIRDMIYAMLEARTPTDV